MRICRFTIGNSPPSYGVIQGQVVYTVEGSLFEGPAGGGRRSKKFACWPR